uniref:C-X-C motif chemokine ligand 8 n=1 Tax=Strigops habroptila TaxID=2489341 RepID=A0A672UZL6_STRHB
TGISAPAALHASVRVSMCPHPMMLAAELRCHCIQTATGLILPKHLANVEIIPKGPHCNAVEIIKQICLDPQAKWVKMIINGILQSKHSTKNKQKRK